MSSTMDSESKKVAVIKTFNIKPSLVAIRKLVNELMKYVDDNRLSVSIAGKRFLQIEAWQFTGSQLNLTAIITDLQDVSTETDKKYRATAEIYHNPTGQLVSRGFASCSKSESKKKTFDEFAIESMAQTRAIGKAYRNILAWLPKLAGYEGTPVEEITQDLKDDMVENLGKIKSDVFTKFRAVGIEDSSKMLQIIQKATGKQTIDNADDAMAVLAELEQ